MPGRRLYNDEQVVFVLEALGRGESENDIVLGFTTRWPEYANNGDAAQGKAFGSTQLKYIRARYGNSHPDFEKYSLLNKTINSHDNDNAVMPRSSAGGSPPTPTPAAPKRKRQTGPPATGGTAQARARRAKQTAQTAAAAPPAPSQPQNTSNAPAPPPTGTFVTSAPVRNPFNTREQTPAATFTNASAQRPAGFATPAGQPPNVVHGRVLTPRTFSFPIGRTGPAVNTPAQAPGSGFGAVSAQSVAAGATPAYQRLAPYTSQPQNQYGFAPSAYMQQSSAQSAGANGTALPPPPPGPDRTANWVINNYHQQSQAQGQRQNVAQDSSTLDFGGQAQRTPTPNFHNRPVQPTPTPNVNYQAQWTQSQAPTTARAAAAVPANRPNQYEPIELVEPPGLQKALEDFHAVYTARYGPVDLAEAQNLLHGMGLPQPSPAIAGFGTSQVLRPLAFGPAINFGQGQVGAQGAAQEYGQGRGGSMGFNPAQGAAAPASNAAPMNGYSQGPFMYNQPANYGAPLPFDGKTIAPYLLHQRPFLVPELVAQKENEDSPDDPYGPVPFGMRPAVRIAARQNAWLGPPLAESVAPTDAEGEVEKVDLGALMRKYTHFQETEDRQRYSFKLPGAEVAGAGDGAAQAAEQHLPIEEAPNSDDDVPATAAAAEAGPAYLRPFEPPAPGHFEQYNDGDDGEASGGGDEEQDLLAPGEYAPPAKRCKKPRAPAAIIPPAQASLAANQAGMPEEAAHLWGLARHVRTVVQDFRTGASVPSGDDLGLPSAGMGLEDGVPIMEDLFKAEGVDFIDKEADEDGEVPLMPADEEEQNHQPELPAQVAEQRDDVVQRQIETAVAATVELADRRTAEREAHEPREVPLDMYHTADEAWNDMLDAEISGFWEPEDVGFVGPWGQDQE